MKMAIKANEITVKKTETKIRQKILVQEGGTMNSNVPCKTIYVEYVDSTKEAKEKVKELEKEYPNNSICYFSV